MAMISAGYTWLAFFYVVTLLMVLGNPAGPIASVMRLRGLRRLGRISYCVYIIHQAVVFLVLKSLPSFVMSSTLLRTAVAPIVAIGITLAVAELSWKFFENKLITRGHSYSYAAMKTMSSPAAL
jgi:peptidoglycan/LPS O-acetylase OafA/YrhL